MLPQPTLAGQGAPTQTFQHCIDAATDKQMNNMAGGMRNDQCPKQDVQRSDIMGNGMTMNINGMAKGMPPGMTKRQAGRNGRIARSSAPRHIVLVEQLADFRDEITFRHGELRLGLRGLVFVAVLDR